MGINVKAERVKIWRKDIEGKKGTFYRYTAGVSTKVDDKRVNAYMPVRFTKKSGAPQKIENGATCDFEGFMGVESYTDREGKAINTPMVWIMSVQFEGNVGEDIEDDNYEQLSEDVPF